LAEEDTSRCPDISEIAVNESQPTPRFDLEAKRRELQSNVIGGASKRNGEMVELHQALCRITGVGDGFTFHKERELH
jgi:hypothetical protein